MSNSPTKQDLQDRIVALEARESETFGQIILLQSRETRFNQILQKISRAAKGYSVAPEQRVGKETAGFYDSGTLSSGLTGLKLTKAQTRQAEREQYESRIVHLERCLSAVQSIADFAQEHKD